MARPSEDALIARFLAPLAGPGGLGLADDAALVTPRDGHDLVVTKDMLVAGVHFFADDCPEAIAAKALRVNLSDLAAKGAAPIGFLLGLALPTDWSERWLAAFVAGLGDEARRFDCPLLGGDTVAIPGPLTLSITAFGDVPCGRMVSRSGAKAGDRLYVSGTVGDAALGLQVRRNARIDASWLTALPTTAADALLGRHLRPEPRLVLREALRAHAHAAMDVSDGFVGDLGKMVRLAGLTARVASADIPLSAAARAAIKLEPSLLQAALTGGDDYEIVCAIAPDQAAAFEAQALTLGVPVTCVGTVTAGAEPLTVHDSKGVPLNLASVSFTHFT